MGNGTSRRPAPFPHIAASPTRRVRTRSHSSEKRATRNPGLRAFRCLGRRRAARPRPPRRLQGGGGERWRVAHRREDGAMVVHVDALGV